MTNISQRRYTPFDVRGVNSCVVRGVKGGRSASNFVTVTSHQWRPERSGACGGIAQLRLVTANTLLDGYGVIPYSHTRAESPNRRFGARSV